MSKQDETRPGLLGLAYELAFASHAGQTDKSGAPYITHLVRVSAAVGDAQARIVALLHDVVEDTPVTLAEITDRFGPEISAAVDAMTKRKGEIYDEYLARVRRNPTARAVKLADLADNQDPARLALLPQADQERLAAKYKFARMVLEGGN